MTQTKGKWVPLKATHEMRFAAFHKLAVYIYDTEVGEVLMAGIAAAPPMPAPDETTVREWFKDTTRDPEIDLRYWLGYLAGIDRMLRYANGDAE